MTSNPAVLKTLLHSVTPRQRERLEFILEPLQSILQIAFLSFCPTGSKLTIRHNILEIQLPTYSQGIIRWFQSDSKEDLFYVFNVFRRFIQNYTFLDNIVYTPEQLAGWAVPIKKSFKSPAVEPMPMPILSLYQLLIQLAKSGLRRLIQTYNHANNHTITHTLQIYETMLNKPEIFQTTIIEEFKLDDVPTSTTADPPPADEMNMDMIFTQIRDVYSLHDLLLIYNTLIRMTQTDKIEDQVYSMDGLNKQLTPINYHIQEWIQSRFRI